MSRSATRRGRDSGWPEWFVLPQNLRIYDASLVEGYEAAGDWTAGGLGSVSDDTTNYKQGTQGIKLAISGTGYGTMDQIIAWTPGAGTDIYWYTYADAVIPSHKVYISSVANYAKHFLLNTSSLPAGWTYSLFHRDQFTNTGGESWNNQMIRIRHRCDVSGASYCTLDGLSYGSAHMGGLLLRFDDGLAAHYSEAFVYMRARGVRGNLAIYASAIDTAGYLTSTQIQDIYAHGWDVLNHTDTATYLTALTEAQQQTAIGNGATFLAGLGIGDSRLHLVFPAGQYNADTLSAMTATGMLTGQTVTPAANNMSRIATLTTAGLDGGWTSINAQQVVAADTLATVKARVDTAQRYGQLLILVFHNLVASGASGADWSFDRFEALIDYIVAQQIPTLRMTDLWALKDGPLTVAGYRR